MRMSVEAAMEPYDLEQVIREEMKFVGLSGETVQQGPVEGTPDPDAAAREIESAIIVRNNGRCF